MKSSKKNESNVEYGTNEKTLFNYVIGIIVCVLATLVPYFAVSNSMFPYTATVFIIYFFAVLQFFAQLMYFLRLNYTSEQARLNTLSFALTIIYLFILVLGSLWIMWNLGYNMAH